MSDAARVPDPSLGGAAVDQSARAAEALTVEIVPSADDVVESLRSQMKDLDASVADKDAAIERERERAAASDRARAAAERRAADAESRARDAQQAAGRSVDSAQLDSIKNSLATHEGHLKNLAAQKATALAEGDFTKASDLDADMAKVGGRIAQLESGAADLEARVKAPPPADPGRTTATDQVDTGGSEREKFISTQPPRIQDWLRSSKGDRYFTDQAFQDKVAAAASFAQKVKGLSIDSQAYIDYIEEQVGLRTPTEPAPTPTPVRDDRAPSTPGQGREADAGQRMTTAPAGGATEGSVRRNPNGTIEVYLTADEKSQAARMGVSETDWAKSKAELIREGRIGPGAR
jgi:hypothetical protein